MSFLSALQIVNMFQYYGWNIAQYIVGTGVHAASFQSGINTQFNSLGWTLQTAYFNPNASADIQLEQQFADVLNHPYRCTMILNTFKINFEQRNTVNE